MCSNFLLLIWTEETEWRCGPGQGIVRSNDMNNIFGEVEQPGSYSISAINTAFNALIAAGGPTDLGSVREIQLIRNGKTQKRKNGKTERKNEKTGKRKNEKTKTEKRKNGKS